MAKGSFLSKDPSQPHEALAYRILLVLPVFFRKWVTTRLLHLGPWIQTWATDTMFARVPVASAEDAWYGTLWITSILKSLLKSLLGAAPRRLPPSGSYCLLCLPGILLYTFCESRYLRQSTQEALWHTPRVSTEYDVCRFTHEGLGHSGSCFRGPTKNPSR